ncbi:MAG: hypothetical protein NTX56_03990 [Proteobacteria bacterium]|nr:hypothetical protein [Pseudomonadota bacterium]
MQKKDIQVIISGEYCLVKSAGEQVSLVQFPDGKHQYISNSRMKRAPDEKKE